MTAEVHAHDVGITVSMGDIPADLMPAAILELTNRLNAVVEEWLKESDLPDETVDALIAADVEPHWNVSYDGRREHGCAR